MTEEDGRRPLRRALVSVYDKTGLPELVRSLDAAAVAIISTGHTAELIASLGIAVTPVEQLTGFGERLAGRVKTLHPAVHAGLLADLRNPAHRDELAMLGIEPFDVLVCNFYPFARAVAAGEGIEATLEQIDIGGPAMVRAAAKNHANVAVVSSPVAYPQLVAALERGGFTAAQRATLAAQAFADIAAYDVAIANWSAQALVAEPKEKKPALVLPPFVGSALYRANVLRYGENPHQQAALYVEDAQARDLAGAQQLSGKEMSFNNYVDADAAWRACHDFAEPAVVIVKHANPCGIAVGVDVVEAYERAFAGDPESAFGGIVAANRPVSVELAKQVSQIVTDVIVAPGYTDEAVQILSTRKNLRVLQAPPWQSSLVESRPIAGGVLMQSTDRLDAPGDDPVNWRLACGAAASEPMLRDLEFAWRAARSVKSNAILIARDRSAVGIGMGQVSRVDAARLAVARCGDRASGAVAASDAFFAFADALTVLAEAGVSAVVQPGGSLRDAQVIEAADAAGLTMYLTGVRHFRH